ncbi:MAG: guanylate kinase [Gammaproteobacteria bacterium]|nr:guanylate kinase [Gammaproteobacteria bacterium]MCP4089935.1 guanylate kinase [Gammaproteobacteria bacterium]MCP4276266.1 guanylate kinase [Gammaproteobacteria bacterium]MCP4831261.1 guanylate kinase [Gammaproteobacteria bacterium]MCP4928744.1 guanylate kinase [Gammaproteobacteria bacterium]
MNTADTQRGHLFVIAAPSGAGKTTLVHRLLQENQNLRFSISYTTRPHRSTETDGVDYHFVSPKVFQAMVNAGDFLEYASVFDYQYGTSKTKVEALLNKGLNVILEIDWQGAQQVRAHMPDCRSIFIMPPSVDELKRRLTSRDSDSPAVIERRFRDVIEDMSHWHEFDYTVINENLENAATELNAIIRGKVSNHEASEAITVKRVNAILGLSET